jgi:hypothetical protein
MINRRALWHRGFQGKGATRIRAAMCCHAIGRRPDLPIANDGAVKGCLLGSAAVVDPGCDATGWWFILDAAPDLRAVKTLQDNFQSRRGERNRVSSERTTVLR